MFLERETTQERENCPGSSSNQSNHCDNDAIQITGPRARVVVVPEAVRCHIAEVGFRGTGEVDYPNCTRPYGGLPFLERVERYIDYIHTRVLECLNMSECLSIYSEYMCVLRSTCWPISSTGWSYSLRCRMPGYNSKPIPNVRSITLLSSCPLYFPSFGL